MSLKAFFSFFLIIIGFSRAQAPFEPPGTPIRSDSSESESHQISTRSKSVPDSRDLQEFKSAQSMVTVGHVLAGGGFVIRWIGNLSSAGPLIVVGNIAYAVGVPVLGVGAGKVNRAAVNLNTGYEPDYRGWGWYWTGLALDFIGTVNLIGGINAYNDARTEEEQEEASSQIASGILFALTGGILEIVAWVKFARLAGEGSRAGERHSLKLTPYLHLASDHQVAPGLALNLRF